MKKPSKLLLEKGTGSLLLSIEHFNRPSDRGRTEAVLFFLDHAFEMLLKAAILQRGGKIRNKGERQTIGFDECLRRGLSTGPIRFLNETQVLTLQMINGLRDAAYHHLVEVSEAQLYIQAQAGVTLFRDILRGVFGIELVSLLPERVLPVSTSPPTDLAALFEREVTKVKQLLRPGARRRTEAAAALRALAVVESAVEGQRVQPSETELKNLMGKIVSAGTWEDVFPGVASLSLTTEGVGPALSLRLTKNQGVPVQLVKEGTPGASVVAVRRVDELGFYSLGHRQVAEKLNLSTARTTAVIRHFKILADPDCCKEFIFGKSVHRRYSPKAVEKLQELLKTADLEAIWREYVGRSSPASGAATPASGKPATGGGRS